MAMNKDAARLTFEAVADLGAISNRVGLVWGVVEGSVR